MDKQIRNLVEAMMERRPVKLSGSHEKYLIHSIRYDDMVKIMDLHGGEEFEDYEFPSYVHICTEEELMAEEEEERQDEEE